MDETVAAQQRRPRRRRVYLMRHSEVEYYTADALRIHPDDVRLTEAGVEQAHAAGRMLAGVEFDRVVTSGLTRTVDTAAAVLEHASGPPRRQFEVCADLLEIRGGPVDEVPRDMLEEAFLGIWQGVADVEASFLAGETIRSLADRAATAFDALLDEPGWETMLVVGHGAVNRAILSYALTGERIFLGHMEQGTACVNILDVAPHGTARGFERRGIGVRAVNLTAYDLLHEGKRASDIERMYSQYKATLRTREARG